MAGSYITPEEAPFTARNKMLPNENPTFKGDGLATEVRVYYTLSNDKSVQAHRNSKAIGSMIAKLRERDILNEAELDAILEECIN